LASPPTTLISWNLNTSAAGIFTEKTARPIGGDAKSRALRI
jgi:hypothetical protein